MVEPLFKKPNLGTVGIDSILQLDGDEAKHAISVRRMRVGEAIQVTNGSGLRLRGIVESIDQKLLNLRVLEVQQESAPKLHITLVQALAKGDRDELAIQAATEIGVMKVIPWQAERSISRWDEAKASKGQVRWQTICDEAAKQSLRAWHPLVLGIQSSKQLAQEFSQYDQVIVLDPTANVGLGQIADLGPNVAIIVGPEGGIDPAELELFASKNAIRAHLGDSILRTSTAGLVAISVLQASAGLYN
jgi:16S rRNA (uracil1498-N3)-methyltransferase